ncbi:uncharacterized protein LOC119022866 isoform X4 [Acanthopagrus latus]|uniref:uncharacterized protein LOC119022866 isoform X4 n=1 Tax=Acanthopagrus latus TaxID=8177 RepID=UPI00187CAA9E|nr:uncharacterized protein LOC119022866 isoform X4 [Acanthopagrus latus]
MENYLTGMKRKAVREEDNETKESHSKPKTRKYDKTYVALGFTVTTVGDEERPGEDDLQDFVAHQPDLLCLWEKMICRILLLINLTSYICGTFVVNVTQTSYQAEENHNITLEWMFTTKTDSSPNSLFIYCELRTGHRDLVLYHIQQGVEVPNTQDQQFTGRVQCEKDFLREGRIRLLLSRLRTNDSGLYLCEVLTNYGSSLDKCRLSVTAVRNWQESEGPNTTGRRRIGLYCGLGLTAAAAAVLVVCKKSSSEFKKSSSSAERSQK